MAALALVLVGLVHHAPGITVEPCPAVCSCTRAGRGGPVTGAVCEGEEGSPPALGPALAALEVRGCPGEGWLAASSALENLTISECANMTLGWLDGLDGLRVLAVTDSSLTAGSSLGCGPLRSLTSLSLSGTSYPSLGSLLGCRETDLPLRHLDLSDSRLEQFVWTDLEPFPALETVSLAGSRALAALAPPRRPLARLAALSLADTPRLRGLCSALLGSLPALASLRLEGSGLADLPPGLLLLPSLSSLSLPASLLPPCSCHLALLQQERPDLAPALSCRLPTGASLPASSPSLLSSLSCSSPSISTAALSTAASPGSSLTLGCTAAGLPAPALVWLAPGGRLLRLRPDSAPGCEPEAEELLLLGGGRGAASLHLLPNGSLVIQEFGYADRGDYICFVDNGFGNDSVSFHLDLEFEYRNILYYWSILFGFVTAVSFLLLTLAGKLMHHVLWNYGCCMCCCCCPGEPAPRIRQLTTVVDSIETYRIQQLEKLRENYQSNSQRIRDNYSMQVERMREHYTSSRGATQVASESYQTVKEQYNDQLGRMREYSNSQLAKSHENYIFQRQRLRKFSAQNYLKIRETGKYTQKTLNRVLENMPAVGDLTNCRQGQNPDWEGDGVGGDLQLRTIEELEGLELEGDGSLYFTPTGTPMREMGPGVSSPGGAGPEGRRTHRRMVSNLSNFFPFWWGMGQTDAAVTTVAIVETQDGRWNTAGEEVEVLVVGGGAGEELEGEDKAPLALEENLSLFDEDFADAAEEQKEEVETDGLLPRGTMTETESRQREEERQMNQSQSSVADQAEHGSTYYAA